MSHFYDPVRELFADLNSQINESTFLFNWLKQIIILIKKTKRWVPAVVVPQVNIQMQSKIDPKNIRKKMSHLNNVKEIGKKSIGSGSNLPKKMCRIQVRTQTKIIDLIKMKMNIWKTLQLIHENQFEIKLKSNECFNKNSS